MEITAIELKEKIQNGDKVMVDFWATWCGPCKVMKPMFIQAKELLSEEKSDVELYTFNIETDRDFIMDLGIRSVPTIKGYSNGKEIFTEIGLKQTNHIVELSKKLN
jgi:thioredoxin